MTLGTTANRQDYTGDNCTKAFPYTFKILATTDLDVFVDNCQKVITTDYTVSGAGAATGGNVTFVSAPGCGLTVAVVRDVPYTQATAYPAGGPFPESSHEDALDKATMLIQQVKELVTRSWRFAAGSVRAAAGYVVDEPKASTYPRVKSDCSGIEFVALTACGTYADPVTTKGDLIVGGNTGSQERLGMTAGFTLVADASASTGRPSWQPGLSVELTNKVDAALTAGDVVGIAGTCDRAVKLDDVQGCQNLFVVAPVAIGDDCLAIFHVKGVIKNVRAQGTILRGDWVRKSATTKAVESTAVGANCDRMMPAGTLALALTTAAGNLVDLLTLGYTHRQVPVLDQRTGLAMSNGTDATNDIDIAIGAAASDDAAIANREIISLTAAITKRLDAAWAVGTGNGGLDTGAIANTTYHVFVIANPTAGVVDAIFSTSATAPTMPSGYTKKRRIGSIVRASGAILLFTQTATHFVLTTPVLDGSAVAVNVTAVLQVMSVPLGIKVMWHGHVRYEPGANELLYVSSPDATDAAPSATLAPLSTFGGISTDSVQRLSIRTDTSAQIRFRANAAGSAYMATLGWEDITL